MEQIKFYRGGSSVPSTMDTNGLYFTTTGRLYDGKTGELIGESLDKLAIGKSIESVPDYSIVAGTNDKSVVTGLVGSLASNAVNIDIPRSTATCSISYGAGTVVNTTGSNAIGVWNTVGCKGYYWKQLTNTAGAETSTFALSATQPSLFSWEPVSSVDWQIGDTICVIDKGHFPFCATITDKGTTQIGTLNKKTTVTITTTKLPFDGEESITLTTPQNKSICAFYQKTEISAADNKRWLPRSGAAELGWAATAFGVENLNTGSASFATGWNNWQTSSFGVVAGRENISGYSDITGGLFNENIGEQSVVAGKSNKNTAASAIISGHENTNETYNSIVGGARNSLLTKDTGDHLVVGADNKITGVWNSIVGGMYNDVTASNALVVGQYSKADGSAKIIVGGGSSDEARGNVFTVSEKGNVVVGDCNTLSVSNPAIRSIISGARNNITMTAAGGQMIVTGADNTVSAGWNNIVAGNTNVTSHSNILIAGHGNKTSASDQTVVGYFNAEIPNALFIVGCGTSSTNRKNAFEVLKNGSIKIGATTLTEAVLKTLVTISSTNLATGGY